MKFFYNNQANLGGIYKIVNNHTNRIYIGQASCFKKRWGEHKKALIFGKNQNKFLLNDFKKCKDQLGHDDFIEFHIIEVMPGSTKEERNTKEEKYINQFYDNQGNCYNFKQKSDAVPRSISSKNPEITKKILSEKSKKMWKDPKTRAKILKAREAATKTQEYKDALKEGLKKSWTKPERREKFSKSMKKKHQEPGYTEKVTSKMLTERDEDKIKNTFIKNKLKFLKKREEKILKTEDWIGPDVPRAKTFEEANLISPNGILFKKIHNLRAFALAHGISDAWKLQEVIELKRWQYKGWTKCQKIEEINIKTTFSDLLIDSRNEAMVASRRTAPRAKTYGSLIDPKGNVYPNVTNIVKFAREHGLTKQSVYQVLLGKRKSHNGWKLFKNKDPKYKLISPGGEKHCFDFVRKFAREHDLSYHQLHKLLKKKIKNYRGWECPKEN